MALPLTDAVALHCLSNGALSPENPWDIVEVRSIRPTRRLRAPASGTGRMVRRIAA